MIVFVMLRITPKTSAFQNDPILKSSDIPDAIRITIALITKVNNPKDKRIIGNEKNVKRGLSATFNIPMIAATNMAAPKPLMSAPLNNFTPISNAAALTTHLIKRSVIEIFGYNEQKNPTADNSRVYNS